MGVVVELAAVHKSRQISADLVHLLAADEARQVFGVGADVAQRTTRSGLRRVHAPRGLLLARGFQRGAQPVLHVLGVHQADFAQIARRHHGPGLARHGVAAVVVGQRKQAVAGAHAGHQRLRVSQCRGQRLVANHVDAGLQKSLRHGRVQVVGRDDGDRVDAIGSIRFRLRHGAVVAVSAVRRDVQLGGAGAGALGVGRQGAGHQFVAVVHARGDAVHRADERALPATHHAQADAPGHAGAAACFDCHSSVLCACALSVAYWMPSILRLALASTPPPAKSSNARSATRMMWSRMNTAPSRAPSSGCLRQHSHSNTAQPL